MEIGFLYLGEIRQAAEKARVVLRKAKIKATKADHKNAGSKRAVSVQFPPPFLCH